MNLMENNLFFLLIITLLPLLFLTIFNRYSSKKPPPLPPGPRGWPIVGNIFQLGKTPHVTLAKMAQIHGPIMHLKIGTRPFIVGSSPEAAREILKAHDRVLSGRYVSHPIRVKGSKLHNLNLGFLDECSDEWKRVRGVYRGEFFSAKVLEYQVENRERKIAELVKYLGSMEGRVVKIKSVAFFTAVNIISSAVFSRDLLDFEGKGVGEGLLENIRRFGSFGGVPQLADMYPILSGWDLQRMYKQLVDILGKISAVWSEIVKERRQRGKDLSARRDFTDTLIDLGFGDDQINALNLELFSAGTESTSATTEWTLTELMRNPEAMQKLRQELAKGISGNIIRESDLPNLPYLDACVKETLRLHPPGPLLLPHRAIQTCEVMGYYIPKDSQIMVNMWAIARDPAIWDDPLNFKPERFLSSGLGYKGRRFCPGEPLASRVVPVIVASLIHNFDWVLPDKMDPAQIDMSDKLDVTMLKEEPLYAIPSLRRQFI